MSFQQKIKEELLLVENKKQCCEKSQLYVSCLCLKVLHISTPVYVDNLNFARALSAKIAEKIGAITEIELQNRNKGYAFRALNNWQRADILKYFNKNNYDIDYLKFKNDCCEKAFLRAVFLACGKISEPEKEYKIEFVFSNEEVEKIAIQYLQSMKSFKLNLKVAKRKGLTVYYTKDSTQIEDILAFIGAKTSAMDLMQIKMFKEEINNINRKSNCETANMDKTFSASARQVAAIMRIEQVKGLDCLDAQLRELAEFRLDHPQMSLKSLAESLHLSRSAVNYRFNKIISIYESISEE